ncbi:hypothetical protein DL765_003913 [Monosporascus sp. GIB2]|nr:hypothetical protein DL765_003913 [Monosporascus sp. GIB2]
MEYVKSLIKPISSEIRLRDFERDVVENAVEKLIDTISKDALLRRHLGIRGTVTFESHTNLDASQDSISEPMERMTPRSKGALRGAASAMHTFCGAKATICFMLRPVINGEARHYRLRGHVGKISANVDVPRITEGGREHRQAQPEPARKCLYRLWSIMEAESQDRVPGL